MITREQALKIVTDNTTNQNLVRHMLAVEAVMRALAKRLEGNTEKWGIAGLLHDADYESVQDNLERHSHQTVEWIRQLNTEADGELESAILSHAWGFVEGNPEPETKMEWALYTCDELTGFIVAVALVKPDRKLSSVTVDSVLNKWDQKAFAKGVHREQIAMCESRLGIPLREFIGIALVAMQGISNELGL